MVEFVDVLQKEKKENHNIVQVLVYKPALAAPFVFDADIDTSFFF